MGYKVIFRNRQLTSIGFVCPFRINKVQYKAKDEDFDWVDPTIHEVNNEMVFKSPIDDKWYLISEHNTSKEDIIRAKCFMKLSRDDTVEYIITKLEWKTGILEDIIDKNNKQRKLGSRIFVRPEAGKKQLL